jgi:hypothetical protein
MKYLKTTLFIFFNLFFISLSYASSLSVSTDRGTSTSATFEGGAFLSGVTEQSSFYKDNDVTVKVDINISKEDIGINSSIYIIASYNGAFFIKNATTGNWQVWNGTNIWNGGINLIFAENRTLSTQESVTVISGLRNLPGEFLIYIGYLNKQNDIVYNSQPIQFSISSSSSPSDDSSTPSDNSSTPSDNSSTPSDNSSPDATSSENANSAGNGKCVNVPLVAAGRKVTYTYTSIFTINDNNYSSESTQIETFIEVNESKDKVQTESIYSDSRSIHIATSNYKIVDNYIYTSQFDYTNTYTSTIDGETTTISSTGSVIYSPPLLSPALVFCENQTWSSTSLMTSSGITESSGTISGGSSSTISYSGKVEAINEIKITPAGSFNTVRIRYTTDTNMPTSYNKDYYEFVYWISIQYGIHVAREIYHYDTDGNLGGSSKFEMISLK